MGRYVARRLLQLVPVLFGISIISFALMYLSPSDPAMMMLSANGTAPTPELLEQTRREMGLDQPAVVQYANWLLGMLHGNMGYSYVYSAPVAQVLANRMPVTLVLSFASLLLMVAVSVPLGIASATHEGKLADKLVLVFEFFSLSMPTFWLGLLLIYLFALTLGWLPAISNSADPAGYVLPVVALSFSYMGRLIGQVRIDVIEELKKPYLLGLKSRGIPPRQILTRHVLRNALAPSLTVVGLAFGAMLSGSVTTEIVFSLQGLGNMSVAAITGRDYALVQGYVLMAAVVFVLVNLAVDLTYHALNPQVSFEGESAHA